MTALRTLPLAATLGVLLAACAPTASPPEPVDPAPTDDWTQADYEAELTRRAAEIDAAIGEARADTVAQCRLLELGVRPCGGPAEWRAFSTADGDPGEVLRLAALYNARNEEMNRRFDLVSTCEHRAAPEFGLQSGRCVTFSP